LTSDLDAEVVDDVLRWAASAAGLQVELIP
jgi:hypothetical protein